jgi:hypothetical protein
MKINRTFPIITLVISTFIIFTNTVYAGDSMGGLGQALAWLAISVYLEIFSIIVWFIIHIFSKKSSRAILFVRSLIDLITILITLNLLRIFGLLNIELGLFESFYDRGGHYSKIVVFFIVFLIILFILVLLALYFLNKWIMSVPRFERILNNFFVCFVITFIIPLISWAVISGPIGRWFITPEFLIVGYGDPRGVLSEYFGFDQETIAFYNFEKKLYDQDDRNISKTAINHSLIVNENSESLTDKLATEEQAASHLILTNIGNYEVVFPSIIMDRDKRNEGANYAFRLFSGFPYWDHFILDHTDVTYYTEYKSFSEKQVMFRDKSRTEHQFASVQLTKHANGDSDKWLLHDLWNALANKAGKLSVIEFDGNTFFFKKKPDMEMPYV